MSNINTPIVNAPTLYVNGLALEPTGLDKLAVFAGSARDSTNQNDIILFNDVNINLLTNGALGLDQGTILPDTFYSIYVIGDSTDNNPGSAIASLNSSNLLLPKGYDMARRIGWVVTNNEGQLFTQIQMGSGLNRTYYYASPIFLYSGSPSTTAIVDLSLGIPNRGEAQTLEGIFEIEFQSVAAADQLTFTTRNTGSGMVILSNGFIGTQISRVSIPTVIRNASPTNPGFPAFFVTVTSSSDVVSISALGFKDYL